MQSYTADKDGAPFKSGSDEQHQAWHDIIEEIIKFIESFKEKNTEQPPLPTAADLKEREQDLKEAGEMLRGDRRKLQKRRAKRQKVSTKSQQVDYNSDSEDVQVLTPTDRLANALSAKLEAETKQVGTPATFNHAPPKLPLTSFTDNRHVLNCAGISNKQIVHTYCQKLDDFGFKTPLLMLGL